MKKFFLIVFLCLFSFNVQAQSSDDRYPQQYQTKALSKKYVKKLRRTVWGGFRAEINRASEILGGRPAGCPRRFCGCALSIKMFGRIVPHLNLAANWLKFPRANPAPGMVAARRDHVFKLLAHVSGDRWSVWDANSGRGRIRIHNRSIAGFKIVNARAG